MTRIDLRTIEQAWAQRRPRERAMLCLAALVVPLLLADTLVWNPWRMQMKSLNARAAQADQEIAQLSEAQVGLGGPRDAASVKQLDALRQRVAQAERASADVRARIVTPQQMAAKLREITQGQGATTVVALRSLAVAPVENGGGVKLYRHAFELQLEGGYADIARYVEHLEQTAPALRWNAIELDASRHPVIGARLEVFTLSEQSSWIQL